MAEEPNTTSGMDEAPNVTFEAWLDGQPDNVRSLYNAHIGGLKSALTSERESTKSLSKQLRELQNAAEEGSELKKRLSDLQAQYDEIQRYNSFMDGAAGAGCANAKAAYKIAKADENLWKRDGAADWDAIKAEAPELFGTRKPEGNAGTGTGSDPNAGHQNWFDDKIRAKGRR